ncbi:helix-turn-helix domain-containing protein [Streptomyces sp. 900105245]
MATDFQQAREALGRRLRELRGQRTQRDIAGLLGWPQAKVSKLETGRQTATPEDVIAWANASGHPSTTEEFVARPKGDGMPEWTDPRYADLINAWRRERQLTSGESQ